MDILSFWPTIKEVDACIRTEAETADEAVLLAVHEPARLKVRNVNSKVAVSASESEMLTAFTAKELGGGSLLMPITGASGVGKSHMIRWLGAQLRRHPRASQMHIITIPKSASLRGVISRILEPLKGTQYDLLRTAIDTSVAAVSDGDAAIRLAAELTIVLKAKEAVLAQQLRSLKSGDPELQALKTEFYHTQSLQKLLLDPGLSNHIQGSVLSRIVRRTVHGLDPKSRNQADTDGQFSEEDLSDLQDRGLSDSSAAVKLYYQTVLDASNDRNRKVAVRVLTEALDPAVRGVFQLTQAAGQMTMEDIVERIRVQLFHEGKELVLLVEDFAALAGIQESILNLSIVESTHGGKQERAVLRTALAITDGYLKDRETQLTRAKQQWIVMSEFDTEDSLMDHCIGVAGRYLNAARWGAEELKQQYKVSAHRDGNLTDWVNPYESESLSTADADTLAAFGKSQHNHWLFPFNSAAIKELCKFTLPRPGGRLLYNPRALIDGVLREPLIKRRQFETGQFPEAGYKEAKLASTVQVALDDALGGSADSGRAATVLYFWGGNPSSQSAAAQVPVAIYRVFGVTAPSFADSKRPNPRPSVPTKPTPVAEAPEGQRTTLGDAPELVKFGEMVREWAAGKPLTQSVARTVRNEWARAIHRRIEYTELRVRGAAFGDSAKTETAIAATIFVPGALAGNPADTESSVMFTSPENRDPSGRIQIAMMAIRRRNTIGSWIYEGGENDFACYAWLLSELTGRTLLRWQQDISSRLQYLVPRLRIQSDWLGIPVRSEQSPVQLLFATLSEESMREMPSSDQIVNSTDQLLSIYVETASGAISTRTAIQKEVASLSGCFQGETGRDPLAFDSQRIAAAMKSAAVTDARLAGLWPDLRTHFSQLTNDRINIATDRTRKWLREIAKGLNDALGEGSFQELVDSLDRVVESATKSTIGADIGVGRQLVQRLRDFPAIDVERVKKRVKDALGVPEEADSEAKLRALAQVPYQSAIKLRNVIADLSTALQKAHEVLEVHKSVVQKTDPVPVADAIVRLLESTEKRLVTLNENAA
jgi:hypothetical protein